MYILVFYLCTYIIVKISNKIHYRSVVVYIIYIKKKYIMILFHKILYKKLVKIYNSINICINNKLTFEWKDKNMFSR